MADNPSAFPIPADFRDGGMTLRDWFAGQALAQVMAQYPKDVNSANDMGIALIAYCMADAMLEARK